MKLTKRILCLALALTLIFALAACGKKNNDNNKTGTTTENVTTTTTDDWAGNLEGDNIYNDGQLSWG